VTASLNPDSLNPNSLNPNSLNPYASPQPAESCGLDPNRLLTATFVVDERWQRRCAAVISLRQQRWLGLGMILAVVTGAFGGALWAIARERQDFILVGAFAGLWIGAITGLISYWPAALMMSVWNRYYRPPACPLGVSRVLIDLARLTWESPSGFQEWLLTDAHWDFGRRQVFLLIKSADLVLQVEATADFGLDDYASWSAELARRTNPTLETD
jgi:hypothetical protein